jgi:hypothetical protein
MKIKIRKAIKYSNVKKISIFSFTQSRYRENLRFMFYKIIKLYLFNISVNCNREATIGALSWQYPAIASAGFGPLWSTIQFKNVARNRTFPPLGVALKAIVWVLKLFSFGIRIQVPWVNMAQHMRISVKFWQTFTRNFHIEIEWLKHFTELQACRLDSQWRMFPKWATNIWANVRKLERHLSSKVEKCEFNRSL